MIVAVSRWKRRVVGKCTSVSVKNQYATRVRRRSYNKETLFSHVRFLHSSVHLFSRRGLFARPFAPTSRPGERAACCIPVQLLFLWILPPRTRPPTASGGFPCRSRSTPRRVSDSPRDRSPGGFSTLFRAVLTVLFTSALTAHRWVITLLPLGEDSGFFEL